MYCTKCGNQISNNSRFCSCCGAPVKSPAVAQNGQMFGSTGKKKKRSIGKILLQIFVTILLILLSIASIYVYYYNTFGMAPPFFPDYCEEWHIDEWPGVHYEPSSGEGGESGEESEEVSSEKASEDVPSEIYWHAEMLDNDLKPIDCIIKYEKDAKGRITKATLLNSDSEIITEVDYEYDSEGHVITGAEDGITFEYGENSEDFVVSPVLERRHYTWDGDKLKTSESDDRRYSVEYEYDEDGNLERMTFREDGRRCIRDKITVDDKGRKVKGTRTVYYRNDESYDFDMEWEYDGDTENITWFGLGDGHMSFSYDYDDEGRIVECVEKRLYNDSPGNYKLVREYVY